MGDKRITANLVKYVHDTRTQATSHDKFHILLTATILIGVGVATFHDLVMPWPKEAALAIGLLAVGAAWVLGFAAGVKMRARIWEQKYPPYELIARATVPCLVIALAAGLMVGRFMLDVPTAQALGVSFLGWLAVGVLMHLLFALHAPWTKAAIKTTGNPNINTVDSHRHAWFFPALGVLAIYLAGFVPALADAQTSVAVAVSAAIATSWTMAGFGSGYIP